MLLPGCLACKVGLGEMVNLRPDLHSNLLVWLYLHVKFEKKGWMLTCY